MAVNDEIWNYTAFLIEDAHLAGAVLTKYLYEARIYWNHGYVKKLDHWDIQVSLRKLEFNLTSITSKASLPNALCTRIASCRPILSESQLPDKSTWWDSNQGLKGRKQIFFTTLLLAYVYIYIYVLDACSQTYIMCCFPTGHSQSWSSRSFCPLWLSIAFVIFLYLQPYSTKHVQLFHALLTSLYKLVSSFAKVLWWPWRICRRMKFIFEKFLYV